MDALSFSVVSALALLAITPGAAEPKPKVNLDMSAAHDQRTEAASGHA